MFPIRLLHRTLHWRSFIPLSVMRYRVSAYHSGSCFPMLFQSQKSCVVETIWLYCASIRCCLNIHTGDDRHYDPWERPKLISRNVGKVDWENHLNIHILCFVMLSTVEITTNNIHIVSIHSLGFHWLRVSRLQPKINWDIVETTFCTGVIPHSRWNTTNHHRPYGIFSPIKAPKQSK